MTLYSVTLNYGDGTSDTYTLESDCTSTTLIEELTDAAQFNHVADEFPEFCYTVVPA